MAEITSLTTLAKTSVATTDYLLVANSSTKASKKFQLSSLFPSLNNEGAATSGQALFSGITSNNQLDFYGLKSADTKIGLSVVSGNIILTLSEADIDLANCNNSTAGFLTAINFGTDSISGILGTVNGGTGLATVAKGAVLYASDADTWKASDAMSTNGTLLIGNSTTGVPTVAALTAGANVTITPGAGSITIAASMGTLAANLDTDTFNIDLATNYISPDGTDKGFYVHTTGVGILNPSASALDLSNATGQLNLQGSGSIAMVVGNTNAYQSRYDFNVLDAGAGVGGAAMRFNGAAGGSGNTAGGLIELYAGNASGSGAGGNIALLGGDSASGTRGNVSLWTYNSGSSPIEALRVDEDQHVRVLNGEFYASKTIYARASTAPPIVQYQGAHSTTDDGTTAISAANIAAGIITCTPTADRSKATDTASNLITGLNLDADNDSVDFSLISLATDGTSDITITAGSGVTLVGNMIVKSQDDADDAGYSGAGRFRVRRTGASAVTIYRLS